MAEACSSLPRMPSSITVPKRLASLLERNGLSVSLAPGDGRRCPRVATFSILVLSEAHDCRQSNDEPGIGDRARNAYRGLLVLAALYG
jgi:hypothetical protein